MTEKHRFDEHLSTALVELDVEFKNTIIQKVRELYSHLGINCIIQFGSSVSRETYRDIDLVVVVRSDDVMFQTKQVDGGELGVELDIKLVRLAFVELLLNEQFEQVTVAQLPLKNDEKWLILALSEGRHLFGEVPSKLCDLADKIKKNSPKRVVN